MQYIRIIYSCGVKNTERIHEKSALQKSKAHSVPKRSRTSGLLLRRQSLYPTELLGHNIYILSYYYTNCKYFGNILLF